ncbi:MAG: cytochrome c [Zoogloeaceae bacterium]|jgi:mono/diheme cytochrome c family protein|nr:cytochrome c [Zoogloeaceae bacterium]
MSRHAFSFLKPLVSALLISSCATAAQAGDGETIFLNNCAACHGMDAEGIPGVAPMLQNEMLWKTLDERAIDYIAGVVTSGLSGKIQVNGKSFNGVMPPQTHLSSKELAAVTNYVLQKVNRSSVTVDIAHIERARQTPLTYARLYALRTGEITLAQAGKAAAQD